MQRAGTPSADSLRGQLMQSNSARFLDRMFCADQGFQNCARPWRIQAMASAFGWDGGCATPREDCGKRDLLFGRALDAAAESGRVTPLRLRPETALDTNKVRACANGADGARGSKDDWEKCSGGVVVDVVAEGWG